MLDVIEIKQIRIIQWALVQTVVLKYCWTHIPSGVPRD